MERDVDAQGHGFKLSATPLPSGGWRAMAIGHAPSAHAPDLPQPRPGSFGVGSPLGVVEDGWSADGATAEGALDALQERVGAAIREAAAAENRAELEEANRRLRERERRIRPPWE